MTSVDDALALWRTQLSVAARRSLAVNWSEGNRSLRFLNLPVASIAQLMSGAGLEWAALAEESGIAVPDALESLMEKAEEAFRDRGHHGTNLVVGTVTVPGVDGALPLMLLPLGARRRARRLPDIDLEPTGPLSLCRATTDLLQRDFGVSLPLNVGTLEEALEGLSAAAARTLPGGVVVVVESGVAVQTSGWLDIQRDLETFTAAGDALLIRALAGDGDARVVARAAGPAPSEAIRPTVLPADASQLEVLRRAATGSTIIVEGPPGTGKSQTIANLLAAAVQNGQSVLFVAQKRAAVDVVISRLQEVGLERLVLDLHDDTARFVPPQLTTLDVDLTAPLPAPPNLMLARRHAGAVLDAWPYLPVLIRRGGEAIPDLSADTAARLGDRASIFAQALSELSGVQWALQRTGFRADSADLLAVAADPDRWRRTADGLAGVPAGVTTLDDARAAAAAARKVAQTASHLRADAALPTVTQAEPRMLADLYRGQYTDPDYKAAVVNSFLEAAAILRRVGAVHDGATVGDVASLAANDAWAAIVALDLDWCSRVVRTTPPTEPLSRCAPGAVAEVLRAVATAAANLSEEARGLLTELDRMGLLRRYSSGDDAAALFAAAIAERRVAGLPLLRAADVEAERTTATAALDLGRALARLRVLAAAERRRVAHRDDPAMVDHLVAFEGLVRHARTRKVRNAEVLRDATTAAMALFPIVVASPTGAARSVPQVPELFDLVVFDEASQVETFAAVPALARASQAVIFGDSLQLPPDRFFQTGGPATTDAVLSQTSLLDSFATLLTGTDRTVYLRWHYRSRDGRLVDFVNDHPLLYGGRMLVLPAPPTAPNPLQFVRNDGDVVAAVTAVLQEVDPTHSCAVITMGIELADRLQAALTLPPSPDEFEPSVVRNVERFQGDERDHIVLVLPTVPAGGSPLQALGPINQAGGERRLNVALTRARVRLTVVSAFGSADLAGAQSPGGTVLRDLLASLESPRVRTISSGELPHGGDEVVAAMAERLIGAGLQVLVDDMTAAGVVLAVRGQSDRVLAVDVDTPALARLDALDREILLPSELERRGWHRVRVTARDWVERPDLVVQHIKERMEALDVA